MNSCSVIRKYVGMQERNPMCAMQHINQVLNSSVGTVTLFKDSGTGGIAVVSIGLLGEALLLRFVALLCVELKNPF